MTSKVSSKVYKIHPRGGYRIPDRRGRQPSGRWAPAYKFARFVEKLHEIKKSLVGGAPGAPPLGYATAPLPQPVMQEVLDPLLLPADVYSIRLTRACEGLP